MLAQLRVDSISDRVEDMLVKREHILAAKLWKFLFLRSRRPLRSTVKHVHSVLSVVPVRERALFGRARKLVAFN